MKKNSYMNMLAELNVLSAHPGGKLLTKQMINELGITPDMTILDAGCGLGETARFISEMYGCKVNAIDSHPVMVSKARKNLENNKNVVVQFTTVLDLPFAENSFHHVICESVLSFTHAPKALKEIQRVLKDDGQVLINEMCLRQPFSSIDEKKVKNFYEVETLYTKNDWLNLLKNSGFSKVTEMPFKPSEEPATEILLPDNITREQLDILDEHAEMLSMMSGHVEPILLSCEK
ncbi:hypothetical protein CR203_04465 [Salipaludibacillus neizhouensis]|uniref:Methyltransferase domain-containing protein n=1 Tax=Salipaludibacillus neizhouensis TaxID=885475 RepID=A0A3A9KY64_9BACI|nr:class I SAM-dependent methyltransferase [Salipaludibacillus neizhouensis]RKL69286.1 hypothetical protein CR203_04465 [Salipaludibacillus neizhouensis]